MIRKDAVEIITKFVGENPIISANGFISRDLYETFEKPSNFYMIGSMGLASSIGLGVALRHNQRVYVLDGDGNILMNLGSLTTIGSLKPKNFVHFILDNSSHESTGGQPTSTKSIHIDKIAKLTNYKAFKTKTKNELINVLRKTKNMKGPIMILVKISKSDYVSKRVTINPTQIKKRFMESLEARK